MTLLRMRVALAALVASSGAFAETDCPGAIAEWKPRELFWQEVEQHGWTVRMLSRLMPFGERAGAHARAAPV